jgi:hypothetical protein
MMLNPAPAVVIVRHITRRQGIERIRQIVVVLRHPDSLSKSGDFHYPDCREPTTTDTALRQADYSAPPCIWAKMSGSLFGCSGRSDCSGARPRSTQN